MNQKIRELALQAGVDYSPDQAGLSLFAELLIQECARIADCPSSFKQTNGYKILRHFGVAEQV